MAVCLKVAGVAAGCKTPPVEHAGVPGAYVCRLLPLSCLAPDIVEAIRASAKVAQAC